MSRLANAKRCLALTTVMVLFLASPSIAQQSHGKPPLPPNGFWRRMANHHLKRITILRPTPDAQVKRP